MTPIGTYVVVYIFGVITGIAVLLFTIHVIELWGRSYVIELWGRS